MSKAGTQRIAQCGIAAVFGAVLSLSMQDANSQSGSAGDSRLYSELVQQSLRTGAARLIPPNGISFDDVGIAIPPDPAVYINFFKRRNFTIVVEQTVNFWSEDGKRDAIRCSQRFEIYKPRAVTQSYLDDLVHRRADRYAAGLFNPDSAVQGTVTARSERLIDGIKVFDIEFRAHQDAWTPFGGNHDSDNYHRVTLLAVATSPSPIGVIRECRTLVIDGRKDLLPAASQRIQAKFNDVAPTDLADGRTDQQ